MTNNGHPTARKRPFAKCEVCPLQHSPIVPSDPIRPNAKLHVVGESPGRNEVNDGMGFTGFSGKVLWRTLAPLGITREDCNVTNAVLCAPPSDYDEKQEVLDAAANCCRPRLLSELATTNAPILALGKTARESIFGPQHVGESLTTLHGRWTKIKGRWSLDEERAISLDKWAISAYHPAFILRSPNNAKDFGEVVRKAAAGALNPDAISTPQAPTWEIVTDLTRLLDLKGVVAFDLETDQIGFTTDDILLAVFADGPNHALIVPGLHPEVQDILYSQFKDPVWTEFWHGISRTFVGHNGKFDVRFIRQQLGHLARVDFDTLLAHYALDERPGTHDLKGLSARYLDVADYETNIKQYLRSKNDRYSKIPFNELCQYAAWDATCTFKLYRYLADQLNRYPQVEQLFYDEMMPANAEFIEAELYGMHVDTEYLAKVGTEFEREMELLTSELSRLSNRIIVNPNSWQQVSEAFYVYLKFPRPHSRRIKPNSTNHDAIVWLEEHGVKHPIIDVLKRYRKISKLNGSYVENILDATDENGDIHPDNQQHGTEHGRISVKNPAAQTWPRPYEEHSKPIRDSIVARPGKVLVVVDINQAEMRCAAAMSGDEFLIDVYARDADLHTEVAIAMFGDDFTREQRVQCKMFNFSYLYGGSEYSFAQDQGLPIEVAREFVQRYNKQMPRLAAWKQERYDEMLRQGYVQYRTGRRRRIPMIVASNQDEARKASFNGITAGSSSDIVVKSMTIAGPAIREAYGAQIILLVHDSIDAESPIEHVKEVGTVIEQVILQVATEWFPEVKWKCEIQTGDRLGSVK